MGAAVFVPGVLALSQLAAARRPANGDAVRVLLLIGLSAFSAIFASEMLVGRYTADGASASATAELLRTLQSGPVLGVLGVLGSAFFVGVAAFAIPFIREGGPWRAPSLLFALGALLVLVEIISAQVVFSQVGNVDDGGRELDRRLAPPIQAAARCHLSATAPGVSHSDGGATNMTIKVAIVDDQALMRDGFSMILDAQPDIDVVGDAENGRLGVELCERTRPDVVLMDIRMPVLDGIEAPRLIT